MSTQICQAMTLVFNVHLKELKHSKKSQNFENLG